MAPAVKETPTPVASFELNDEHTAALATTGNGAEPSPYTADVRSIIDTGKKLGIKVVTDPAKYGGSEEKALNAVLRKIKRDLDRAVEEIGAGENGVHIIITKQFVKNHPNLGSFIAYKADKRTDK